MKGYNRWSYAPYIPADRLDRPAVPYICCLAPGEHSLGLEWRYPGGEGACTLCYTLRGAEDEGKSWGTPVPILCGSADTHENGNHRIPHGHAAQPWPDLDG